MAADHQDDQQNRSPAMVVKITTTGSIITIITAGYNQPLTINPYINHGSMVIMYKA